MERVVIREGQVFAGPRHIRRVVAVLNSVIGYSKGGTKVYHCQPRTFKRFMRTATEITGAEVIIEGDLLGGEDE